MLCPGSVLLLCTLHNQAHSNQQKRVKARGQPKHPVKARKWPGLHPHTSTVRSRACRLVPCPQSVRAWLQAAIRPCCHLWAVTMGHPVGALHSKLLGPKPGFA